MHRGAGGSEETGALMLYDGILMSIDVAAAPMI